MRHSTRFTESSNNFQCWSLPATDACVSSNRSRDLLRDWSSCWIDSTKLVSSTAAVAPSFGQTSKWRCNLAVSTSIESSSRSLSCVDETKIKSPNVNEWADSGHILTKWQYTYLAQLRGLRQPQWISINRRLLQADEDLLETAGGGAVQPLERNHPLVNLAQFLQPLMDIVCHFLGPPGQYPQMFRPVWSQMRIRCAEGGYIFQLPFGKVVQSLPDQITSVKLLIYESETGILILLVVPSGESWLLRVYRTWREVDPVHSGFERENIRCTLDDRPVEHPLADLVLGLKLSRQIEVH